MAGTHGKTTTSSMLALALREAGLNPCFIIGGDVNEIGTGAMWDTGEWFVVEADESDRTFLAIDAEVAVVTSVEADHLESYGGSPSTLVDAFGSFLAAARHRVVCADDPAAAGLAAATGAVTYGTADNADFRMSDVSLEMPVSAFDLFDGPTRLGRVTLPTPGLHNARNAAAAVVAALTAGASFEYATRALARFGGVARRFEFRGDAAGVTFVDDYAHLPSEVAGGHRRRSHRRLAQWWCASSSRTATAGSRPSAETSRTPSPAPTIWSSPGSTRRAKHPGPASPPRSSSMRCSTPILGRRSRGWTGSTRSPTGWWAGCAPATSA